MWWKAKKKSESQFCFMALGFLAHHHDVQFEGHCTTCDAYQPVYFWDLVKEHGKTAIFRDIEPKILCIFRKKSGGMYVRFTLC